MTRVDVSAVGDVNLDLILANVQARPDFGKEVLAQERILRIGGCATNFACGCARLGLRTRLFGRIGCDDFGAFAKAQLASCGVSTDGLTEVQGGQTGVTCAFSMGDRGFITHAGEMARLCADDLDKGALFAARHMHVGSYFLTSALRDATPGLLAEAQGRGLTTSLDTGWDPDDTWEGLDDVLTHVDVFMPNEDEITRIAGATDLDEAQRALSERVPVLVLKLGPEGSVGVEAGRAVRAPAFGVDVLDTTAAGDSFNAGFLWGRLEGLPLRECLRVGNACAAMRISTPGGPERMADEDGLRSFLAQHG